MQKLSKLDWRVLFLGFGLGGCCGIASILGVGGLLTDGITLVAVITLTIGLLHGFILAILWKRREQVQLKTGVRIALLTSACGFLVVLLIRNQFLGQSGATNSLYMLASMNIILAFTHPILLGGGAEVSSDKA